MSKLLMDDNPVVVSPKLAVALGLEAAVFMQQVHYWLCKNQGNPIYNTVDAWCVQLPFIGKSTLERIIRSLKEKGVLIVKIIAINNIKTGLYSIDYPMLDALFDEMQAADLQTVKLTGCKTTNAEMQTVKMTASNPQIDGMQTVNLTGLNYIQRRSTETTTENVAPKRSAKPTKEKTTTGLSIDDLIAKGVEQQVAIDWFAVRRDKGSKTLTASALKGVEREASVAGLTLNEAIKCSIEANWIGFEAKWYANRYKSGKSLPSPSNPNIQRDYTKGIGKDGRF